MSDLDYALNRIKLFVESKDQSVLFISDPLNSIKQTSSGMELLREHCGQSFFYHKFSTYTMGEPYDPFLGIIDKIYKEYYASDMSECEFVEAAGVYELHKKIFISYLKRGKATREELVILSEVMYESDRMKQSVLSLLEYISSAHKLVIVLDSVNYALKSSIDMIDRIQTKRLGENLKLLVIYNDVEMVHEVCKSRFDSELSKAVASECQIEYNEAGVKGAFREDVESIIVQGIPLEKSLITEYIRRLTNLYHFMALDDMEYYINHIYSRLQNEKVRMSLNDAFHFYYLGALCYILLGNHNKASIMTDRLATLYDKKREPQRDYDYNFICHQMHLAMNQLELSVKYALTCMDIARKLDDEVKSLEAVILYYEAYYGGWSNVFALYVQKMESDFELVDALQKHGFKNTLAHYLIYSFDNTEEDILAFASGKPSKYYKQAMAIIDEIDNMELALSAYTKYIIAMNAHGMYRQVNELYEKKLVILSDMDNPRREADLYLERGYSYILTEEYEEAEAAFTNAIHILYQLKAPEIIAEALYNVAVNRLCAQDYKSSLKVMEVIFKVLDCLELRSIQLCSQAKLLALYALSNYMMGNDYRCYIELKKIQRLTEVKESERVQRKIRYNIGEDTYLFYFLSALMDKKNKSYDKALTSFKMAHEYLITLESVVFYTMVVFYSEYYELLWQTDHKLEAAELLVEALCHFERYGFDKMTEALTVKVEGGEIKPMLDEAPYTDFAIGRMQSLAQEIGKERQIKKQKKDIWFLSSWQEMLGRDQVDKESLFGDALNAFQDNFNLDKLLYFSINDGEYKVEYSSEKIDESKLDNVVTFFKRNKNEFMSNCVDRDYEAYSMFIDLMDSYGSYTIIGIPVFTDRILVGVFVGTVGDSSGEMGVMTADDLSIMKTAIIQVHITLERLQNKEKMIRINEELGRLAITDQLTGLYNRQGLMSILDEISGVRYKTTVLYIDLDNFKYYNDTFGHEMGDKILRAFANMLKEVAHGDDSVIRYGGDEFVIMIGEGDEATAVVMAEKIYSELEKGELKKLIYAEDEEGEVPENKRLSCSIGIASSVDGERKHIYEALSRADESLYDVKHTTKRNYRIWTK